MCASVEPDAGPRRLGGVLVPFYPARPVRLCRSLTVSAGLLALIISIGCGSSNWSASQRQTAPSVADVAAANAAAATSTAAATSSATATTSAAVASPEAVANVAGTYTPTVLLFVGTGTSSGSVA